MVILVKETSVIAITNEALIPPVAAGIVSQIIGERRVPSRIVGKQISQCRGRRCPHITYGSCRGSCSNLGGSGSENTSLYCRQGFIRGLHHYLRSCQGCILRLHR